MSAPRPSLQPLPLLVAAALVFASPFSGASRAEEAAPLARLQQAARDDELYMPRLEQLCDEIGARLAGSPALARATEWAERVLRDDGHVNVRREPVAVPVWVRGEERLEVLAPAYRPLAVLALGGTVGTPGVEAPVVVVSSFDELTPAVAGTIVLFNAPMSPALPAIEQYGAAARYRADGAARAAEHGALAVLVRSVAARSLATPHTGGVAYPPGVPRIPAAAITVEDAAWIARLAARGVAVRARLELGAHSLPDVTSHNVIGEIAGAERPDEIVVGGGHLDSWDVGQGAHDDGAGIVQTIEAMRLIRRLGLEPRRTIRAVLFTNEENGQRGGKAYAAAHKGERHVAALETDLGGGRPLRWGATGTPEQLAFLARAAAPLGLPLGSGSGADISPLGDHGVLLVGLYPEDGPYFEVHHTHADTFDKIDPGEARAGLAAVVGLLWQLANEPVATP
jgi:carboxypeptidase Q